MYPRKPQTPFAAAIEAATEFKHFLDVQPRDGKLFNPCGKGDPRATATYAHASALLAAAIVENDQCTSSTRSQDVYLVPPGPSQQLVEIAAHTIILDQVDTLFVPASASVLLEKLREAILRCASEAQATEKTDTDARLHSFVAKLSGCMESMGETDMDRALWDLMQLRAQPLRALESAVIARAAATED